MNEADQNACLIDKMIEVNKINDNKFVCDD